MLSAINTAIDTIQGTKTQYVKTFVLNEEIAKNLLTYIDAQSNFAKKIVAETTSFWTSIGSAAWAFDTKKAFGSK